MARVTVTPPLADALIPMTAVHPTDPEIPFVGALNAHLLDTTQLVTLDPNAENRMIGRSNLLTLPSQYAQIYTRLGEPNLQVVTFNAQLGAITTRSIGIGVDLTSETNVKAVASASGDHIAVVTNDYVVIIRTSNWSPFSPVARPKYENPSVAVFTDGGFGIQTSSRTMIFRSANGEVRGTLDLAPTPDVEGRPVIIPGATTAQIIFNSPAGSYIREVSEFGTPLGSSNPLGRLSAIGDPFNVIRAAQTDNLIYVSPDMVSYFDTDYNSLFSQPLSDISGMPTPSTMQTVVTSDGVVHVVGQDSYGALAHARACPAIVSNANPTVYGDGITPNPLGTLEITHFTLVQTPDTTQVEAIDLTNADAQPRIFMFGSAHSVQLTGTPGARGGFRVVCPDGTPGPTTYYDFAIMESPISSSTDDNGGATVIITPIPNAVTPIDITQIILAAGAMGAGVVIITLGAGFALRFGWRRCGYQEIPGNAEHRQPPRRERHRGAAAVELVEREAVPAGGHAGAAAAIAEPLTDSEEDDDDSVADAAEHGDDGRAPAAVVGNPEEDADAPAPPPPPEDVALVIDDAQASAPQASAPQAPAPAQPEPVVAERPADEAAGAAAPAQPTHPLGVNTITKLFTRKPLPSAFLPPPYMDPSNITYDAFIGYKVSVKDHPELIVELRLLDLDECEPVAQEIEKTADSPATKQSFLIPLRAQHKMLDAMRQQSQRLAVHYDPRQGAPKPYVINKGQAVIRTQHHIYTHPQTHRFCLTDRGYVFLVCAISHDPEEHPTNVQLLRKTHYFNEFEIADTWIRARLERIGQSLQTITADRRRRHLLQEYEDLNRLHDRLNTYESLYDTWQATLAHTEERTAGAAAGDEILERPAAGAEQSSMQLGVAH